MPALHNTKRKRICKRMKGNDQRRSAMNAHVEERLHCRQENRDSGRTIVRDSKTALCYAGEGTRRQVIAGRDGSLECYLIGLPQANCIPSRGISLPVDDSSSLLDADVSSEIIASPPASWGL